MNDLYAILVIICSAGAPECNAQHNAQHWWEPRHDHFDSRDSCQMAADALMKANPPPANITGRLECLPTDTSL